MLGERQRKQDNGNQKNHKKEKTIHLDCDSPRFLKKLYAKSPELFKQEEEPTRPRTRGECKNVSRPCPYVTCRYHLFLDVKEESGGGITYANRREIEPCDLDKNASCALDVAEAHTGVGMTLDRIGEFFGVDRERIRQIEQVALRKLRKKLERRQRNGNIKKNT